MPSPRSMEGKITKPSLQVATLNCIVVTEREEEGGGRGGGLIEQRLAKTEERESVGGHRREGSP